MITQGSGVDISQSGGSGGAATLQPVSHSDQAGVVNRAERRPGGNDCPAPLKLDRMYEQIMRQ